MATESEHRQPSRPDYRRSSRPDLGKASSPDYGPEGYLPERAARRGRKIVLRRRMGVGWPLAALVTGVVIAAAGVGFMLTATGPPRPPFVALTALRDVDPRGAEMLALDTPGPAIVVVRAGGGVRAFVAPVSTPGGRLGWCAAPFRLSDAAGSVWDDSGRLVRGTGESLRRVPVRVHNGLIYVDPANLRPGVPPQQDPSAIPCPTS
jgi:hypothetical protein